MPDFFWHHAHSPGAVSALWANLFDAAESKIFISTVAVLKDKD